MLDLSKLVGFEWDEGNLDKSYRKHGITQREAEELFIDPDVVLLDDIRHSQKEKRFTAIGKATSRKVLFAVFTIRKDRVRIISARSANKKERRKYEKAV